MAQLGNIPEIIAVKEQLNRMQEKQLIKEWELPYEDILTRLTAAVFFITPQSESSLLLIWGELEKHRMLHYEKNVNKRLSDLEWRVEFNKGFEL